jgi:hypothetical protein
MIIPRKGRRKARWLWKKRIAYKLMRRYGQEDSSRVKQRVKPLPPRLRRRVESMLIIDFDRLPPLEW